MLFRRTTTCKWVGILENSAARLSTNFLDASIIPLDFAKSIPFSFVYLKTCDYEIKQFVNCMKDNYNRYYEQKIRD